MADEEKQDNLTSDVAEQENTPADFPVEKGKAKPEKPAKTKAHRMTKEEKEAAREAQKNKTRRQQEWEDSLVANKRVKREETRRKLKRALLILLVFSLIMTSTVYIMLLFIEENNVRIIATSNGDKAIELSFDRDNWSPYLDVQGPQNMWNISYDPTYKAGTVPNIYDIEDMFNKYAADPVANNIGGNTSRENVIEFCFFLRNSCSEVVPYNCEMLLSSNDEGLENAIRVMWANRFYGTTVEQESRPTFDVTCYAARSTREVLAYNTIDGNGNEHPEGGVEKIAYPSWTSGSWGSAAEDPCTAEQLQKYEQGYVLGIGNQYIDVNLKDETGNNKYSSVDEFLKKTGYINTVPFLDENRVFSSSSYLNPGEMLSVYVCIWIEGSDFDCGDQALDGYITLSVNFTAT